MKKNLQQMGKYIMGLIIVIGAGLILIEFIFNRHGYFALEDMLLFPAVFGVLSVAVVIIGVIGISRIILRRGEYYDDNA